MKKAFIIILAVSLLSVLIFNGCAKEATSPTPTSTPIPISTPTTAPSPQYGGVLRIILPFSPFQLGPPNQIWGPNFFVNLPAAETLVGMVKSPTGPGGVVGPGLAESWDVAADGKSITFNLRKGIKFHDGTDFNAEAVKYNLEQNRINSLELASVTSIDIIDDYTVRVNLKEFQNSLLYYLTYEKGLIVSPTALKEHEGDEEWLATHLVGTGPFKLVSFERDVSLKFTRNDNYWQKGKPYLDGIEYIFIADVTTAKAALQAGEADMYDFLSSKDAVDLTSKGYQVYSAPGGITCLGGDSNHADSPFANKKVMEAVEYAIDKKSLANTLGYGLWEVADQACSSWQIGYDPNFKGRPYDPAKAQQLLADAGYSQGLKTTIIAENTADMNYLVAVQTFLKAVGIDATLDLADFGRYSTIRREGWENALMSFGLAVDAKHAVTLSRDGPSSYPGHVLPSIKTPSEYDSILQQALATPDADTEIKFTRQLVKMIYDEVMFVPVYVDTSSCAFSESVYHDCKAVDLINWHPADAWLANK
jgi:peptide/nickel transport system substrate-binding protein